MFNYNRIYLLICKFFRTGQGRVKLSCPKIDKNKNSVYGKSKRSNLRRS